MLSTGGLYAPTIRYHDGVVYIVCTNVIHVGDSGDHKTDTTENFMVTTRDIWSSEWSDPLYFDFEGIDPSIFVDDDGKAYIQGSHGPGPWTQIQLFQIDLHSGKKITEQKKIWGGTGGIYPEGPHIYKKDGWYFLLISEGGTHENHAITGARSKDIWGPYEAYENNPILTARETDEYIKYTGHSDIFQDPDGKWWAACLGVRMDAGRFIMGRETFITGGVWPEGGWPSLNQVKMNPIKWDGKELLDNNSATKITAAPMMDFVYIRNAVMRHHNILDGGKSITLTASHADISQWQDPVSFVGRRQRNHDGEATVKMHIPSTTANTNLKAGLAYYKDEHRYVKLFYDFQTSSMVLEVVNKAKGIERTCQAHLHLEDSVLLRITYTERLYVFSYRSHAQWVHIGDLDTLDMTDPDFVGPIIGTYATADTDGVQVRFEDLEIE
jgi:beta-xylosidase